MSFDTFLIDTRARLITLTLIHILTILMNSVSPDYLSMAFTFARCAP